MKSVLELKDQRTILIDRNNTLIAVGKKELRKLNDVEQTEFDANLAKIETLGAEIRTAENPAAAELRSVTPSAQVAEPKVKIRTPLLRAITNRLENRTNEPELQAALDLGKAEFRKAGVSYSGDILLPMGEPEKRADIVAGVATAGQEVVSEDKLSILGPLRNNLVLVKAGAKFISGLIGNVSIPTYAGSTALWKGEVVSSDDGAGAFGEVELAPKRLTTHIDVSKLFLIQDAVDAEALLKSDIVAAIVTKLESTIFGEEAEDLAVRPNGFFTGYDGSLTTLDGSASWASMVGHETAVETANALVDNLAFITNPAARGVLKTTAKGTVSDDIMLMGADNQVNGYPVLVTSGVTSVTAPVGEEGIVFGNWADFVIGQWGGIDLIVDPFTVAKEGKVRIVVNAYFDAKMRRAASFSVASLKA